MENKQRTYVKNISFLIIGLVIGWLLWGRQPLANKLEVQNQQNPVTQQVTPAPATAALGEHCGGNMSTALTCAAGLHCAPTPGSHLPFGDVGGTCVSD